MTLHNARTTRPVAGFLYAGPSVAVGETEEHLGPTFAQGGKHLVHSIGGNSLAGSSPEISTSLHSRKSPPPARLQRKGHSATVVAAMPQDERNRRPVLGWMDVQDDEVANAVVVGIEFEMVVLTCSSVELV